MDESFVCFVIAILSNYEVLAGAQVVGSKPDCERQIPVVKQELTLNPGFIDIYASCLPVGDAAKLLKKFACVQTSSDDGVHLYKCAAP